MRTCDRCWARDANTLAEADYTVEIDNQEFDLCAEDLSALKEFLIHPDAFTYVAVGHEMFAELEGKAPATRSNRRGLKQ